MAVRISVIIPCYNQGHYLKDALASLQSCKKELFETIIVNDGSTDDETLKYFNELKNHGYEIINRQNGGLSAARNTGIEHASGEFVIMLDADNKIRPEFLISGIEAMDSDPGIAVVYGDGAFFGDRQGIRKQGPFNLQKQLLVNYIDACAMIRKSVFKIAGDFDEQMREGWEDWEMWLRIAFRGFKFYYIEKVLFDYRVRADSMAKSVYNNKARTNRIENYIYSKYSDKMGIGYVTDFLVERFRANPVNFIFKLIIRTYFPSYYNKLLSSNKIRNGL